jgi:hypothetical protein
MTAPLCAAGTLATDLGILKGIEALANVVPQPAQPAEQPAQ